ncbi:MAG: transcription termination/antitermination NusG family protein [Verrucomicrobiia bacterium]
METVMERRPGLGVAPWWLIHSRPRQEKRVAAWLEREGFDVDLPLRPRVKVYPGKRVTFHHPVFPGYVFGAFPAQAKNTVYGSGHVAAILEVADQGRLKRELAALHQALEAGCELEEVGFLRVGQRVRITAGRLRGLEGILVRRAGRSRLVLSVEMVQRSVALELDPEWVEPSV